MPLSERNGQGGDQREDRVLGKPAHAAEQDLRAALDELRPSGEIRVEARAQQSIRTGRWFTLDGACAGTSIIGMQEIGLP